MATDAVPVLSPPRSRLILERVLGLTALSNATVTVNPVSGELAYAAGCIVVIYNLRRNKQVRYYRVDKSVSCLCFSPNGQFLAIGEKGYMPTITIWNSVDGKLCAELQRHQYGVACMAFSQDGRFFLSVGLDHDQHLFAWEMKFKNNDVTQSIKVAAVGCALVKDKILDIDFCHAGKFFVTVGEKHFKYWFLDESGAFLLTGRQVNELAELQHRDAVLNAKSSATFTGVGCGYGACNLKTFAVSLDGTLCCLGASGIMERLVSLESNCGNAISVTESFVAVGGSSGIVRLFNPATLEYCTTLPFPPAFGTANEPPELTPTPPSTLYPTNPFRYPAAIASRITGSHVVIFYSDRSIFIYDVTDTNVITAERSFLYHSGEIWGLQVAGIVQGINAKGKLVFNDSVSVGEACADLIPTGTFLTCSDDNTARLWNLDLHRRPVKSNRFETRGGASQPGSECWKNPFSQEMLGIIYNDNEKDFSDETCIVLGGTCSHETSVCIQSSPTVQSPNNGLRAVAIRPDQREFAVGDKEGNVLVIPIPLKRPVIRIASHSSQVNCLAYSRLDTDGTILLASGGQDQLIQLYDCQRGHDVLSTLENHEAAITAVSLSCDGKKLLSCGADSVVSVSEIDVAGKVTDTRRLPFNSGKVFDTVLLPGTDAVVASCNDRLQVLCAKSGKQQQSHLVGEQLQIAVCPANFCVAMSGSLSEKTIHIVDLTTGETLATGSGHSDVITALAFTPDCRRLLSASRDGCIFVWRLADDIQTEMKARLPRVIDDQKSVLSPPLPAKQAELVLPPPVPQTSKLTESQDGMRSGIDMDDENKVASIDKKTSQSKWKGNERPEPEPMVAIPTRTPAESIIPLVDELSVQHLMASPSVAIESPLKDKLTILSIPELDVNAMSSTSLAVEREQLEKRKKQMDTENALAVMNTRLSQLGLLRPPIQPTTMSHSRPACTSPPKMTQSNSLGSDSDTFQSLSAPEAKSNTSTNEMDTFPAVEIKAIISSVALADDGKDNFETKSITFHNDADHSIAQPVAVSVENADEITDALISQALETLKRENPPQSISADVQVNSSMSVYTNGYDSNVENYLVHRREDKNQAMVVPQIQVDASLSTFTKGFVSAPSDVATNEPINSSLSVFTAGYDPSTRVTMSRSKSCRSMDDDELQQIPVNVSLSGFLSGYGTRNDHVTAALTVRPPVVAPCTVDASASGDVIATNSIEKAALETICNLCQPLEDAAVCLSALSSSGEVLSDPKLQEIQKLVDSLRSAITAKFAHD